MSPGTRPVGEIVRVPALTVVPPEWVLVALRVREPAPVLSIEPVPEMAPDWIADPVAMVRVWSLPVVS